jgi:integrase
MERGQYPWSRNGRIRTRWRRQSPELRIFCADTVRFFENHPEGFGKALRLRLRRRWSHAEPTNLLVANRPLIPQCNQGFCSQRSAACVRAPSAWPPLPASSRSLVSEWIGSVGFDPRLFGTHSLRRTKATLIYRRTGNLRAVQLLLGHTKIESTVLYLRIEVDDALAIAEQVDV